MGSPEGPPDECSWNGPCRCGGEDLLARTGRVRWICETAVDHLTTAHRRNLASLMFADPALIDPLALAIQEWNTARARFQSRGFAGSTSLLDALARARAPVALLYGERDAIAWPEVELRFATLRAVRPEAWTGLIPGAGHWVAYEAAEAFDAMLLDMLRRRGGRGVPSA